MVEKSLASNVEDQAGCEQLAEGLMESLQSVVAYRQELPEIEGRVRAAESEFIRTAQSEILKAPDGYLAKVLLSRGDALRLVEEIRGSLQASEYNTSKLWEDLLFMAAIELKAQTVEESWRHRLIDTQPRPLARFTNTMAAVLSNGLEVEGGQGEVMKRQARTAIAEVNGDLVVYSEPIAEARGVLEAFSYFDHRGEFRPTLTLACPDSGVFQIQPFDTVTGDTQTELTIEGVAPDQTPA